MIRINDIQESLLHLVGWEQSISDKNKISDDLTQTDSGLYFQNAHSLLTLQNIRSCMPDEFQLQYPEWKATEIYAKGDKVIYNDKLYIATATNQNETPTTLLSWAIYDVFSDYILRLTKAGISTMVQNFLTEKQISRETKNLLERRTFFDGAGRIVNTETNRGKIVGFEITPTRSMGVTTKIEKIGLQFKTNGEVTIYLFHSSQINPIKTVTLNYTGSGSYQWFTLADWYLSYISQSNNSGGSWYICYNQNDIDDMQAINFTRDWSREPCGTCNKGSLETWRQITKYMMVSPFQVKALRTFAQYPELWDIETNVYTNTRNYGLNCEISVGCDLSDFIISQRSIFANVLQKQVAYNILRLMAMNPDVRVNRNQSNISRMDILYELDGNTAGTYRNGLGYELKQAYKALNIDTLGIDRICLACNNGGVKYTTV